jgi:outer membrane assembly lipoprotein YfgL
MSPRFLLKALAVLALMALFGCASNEKATPTPLQPIKPQIAGRQVWRFNMDGDVHFPLSIAVKQGRFYAASDRGVVVALQAATGKEVWRADVKAKLSAGVGSDGRRAAVVTQDNELVLLDAGVEIWRKTLDAKVVTAPLIAGERVFVVGVDRVVAGFDALDGRKLWTLRRPGDALTLSQASVLSAYKDTLLVGQGARLVGLDPLQGTVRWETVLATPRGSNEVERIADLVGPAARVGSVFCMRAFQSAVGCVDAERGVLSWNAPSGGIQAVAADSEFMFSADASDRIAARKRGDGFNVWTSERLLNRVLSAPLAVGKTVVFGDFEGQVHFLDRETGLVQLRLPTDGSPIVNAPVVSETTMLVTTRNGGLFAFRPE